MYKGPLFFLKLSEIVSFFPILFYTTNKRSKTIQERRFVMSTATTERMSRNDVPQEATWDLGDLYISRRDWDKELAAVQIEIDTVAQYQGKVGHAAKTLLAAAHAFEAYEGRLIRVAKYAN